MRIHLLNWQQMVGFEPTEHVTAQTISSRSRYGHFDTSANLSLINFYYIRILEKMQVLFTRNHEKVRKNSAKMGFFGEICPKYLTLYGKSNRIRITIVREFFLHEVFF